MKKKPIPRPRSGLSLQGETAREFLQSYSVSRDEFRYRFPHPQIPGHFYEDVAHYFEAGDGRIFEALLIEGESEDTRVNGWTADMLPRVSVVRVWKSEDDIRKRNRQIGVNLGKMGNSAHVLQDITTGRPDFPEQVDEWPDLIAAVLKMPAEALDFSPESLVAIDTQRKKRRVTKKVFSEKLAGPLLGYVGEVVRRKVGGQWKMIPSKTDPNVWEPYIKGSDGQAVSWFLQFFDMFEEEYSKFSTETIYSLTT